MLMHGQRNADRSIAAAGRRYSVDRGDPASWMHAATLFDATAA
jgi:hypothetical protein